MASAILPPPERRNEEFLGQARRKLTTLLEPVNVALARRDDLNGDLSGADSIPDHRSFMARKLGCMPM